jgi:CHAT domain-containing protein
MRAHMGQLTLRAQRSLQQLYDLVFAPLEGVIGSRRLVVVPHHAVHYVPFQSLFDGASYLVQRYEISYAPSTAVLLHCLQRDVNPSDTMLLMGVPDERIPRVRQEVESVATLFPGAIRRDGDAATLDALRELAPAAGTIHLACHGYFRADNPLFSSLQLSDGWLTVREARDLRLQCSLVTLSACETGISDIAPGDELIGIARGFMAAGAPSVMMSLWTVDDDSTAMLMEHFYRGLQTGNGPAAALRQAQLHLLESTPHPFYWAPFVVMGRW